MELNTSSPAELDIVIQILSRSGKVKKQSRLKGNNIKLGRALNNDLVLDDPHICPNHAVVNLNENNQLLITDLSSINGLKRRSKKGKKTLLKTATPFNSGTEFYLGKQRIRILSSDHPVAQTQAITSSESIAEAFSSSWVALGCCSLFICFICLNAYLETFIEFKLRSLIPAVIGSLLSFALWPAFWSLISRFFKQEARFVAHITTFACSGLLILMSHHALLALSYNILNTSFFDFGEYTMLFTIGIITISFSLYLSTHLSFKRQNTIAAIIVSILLAVIFALGQTNKKDFSSSAHYNGLLMPPAFLMKKGTRSQIFINNSHHLFENSKKEAKKKKQELEN